jgi:hypothetical protein
MAVFTDNISRIQRFNGSTYLGPVYSPTGAYEDIELSVLKDIVTAGDSLIYLNASEVVTAVSNGTLSTYLSALTDEQVELYSVQALQTGYQTRFNLVGRVGLWSLLLPETVNNVGTYDRADRAFRELSSFTRTDQGAALYEEYITRNIQTGVDIWAELQALRTNLLYDISHARYVFSLFCLTASDANFEPLALAMIAGTCIGGSGGGGGDFNDDFNDDFNNQ